MFSPFNRTLQWGSLALKGGPKIHFCFPLVACELLEPNSCLSRSFTNVHCKNWCLLSSFSFNLSYQHCRSSCHLNPLVLIRIIVIFAEAINCLTWDILHDVLLASGNPGKLYALLDLPLYSGYTSHLRDIKCDLSLQWSKTKPCSWGAEEVGRSRLVLLFEQLHVTRWSYIEWVVFVHKTASNLFNLHVKIVDV